MQSRLLNDPEHKTIQQIYTNLTNIFLIFAAVELARVQSQLRAWRAPYMKIENIKKASHLMENKLCATARGAALYHRTHAFIQFHQI